MHNYATEGTKRCVMFNNVLGRISEMDKREVYLVAFTSQKKRHKFQKY